MTLVEELYDEVMAKDRRLVDEVQCHAAEACGTCWYCLEGHRGRYIIGTGRYIDITHGNRRAVTILSPNPYPFREEEFAGPWLRRSLAMGPKKGMAAKRVPWQKPALRHLDLLPPRFYVGGKHEGEWAYVDITQAYPSIYKHLALDMVWHPDPERPRLYTGRMRFLAEPDLLAAKSMQRAVGGMIRSTEMTQLVNGRVQRTSTVAWSKFLAPDLWGIIQWTLHSIARMAIDEFGCVMFDTDGGVVPLDQAQPLMAAISDRWHLASKIEHQGRGTVWGVKHWDIGDDKTMQGARRKPMAADGRVLRPSPAIVGRLTQA